MIVVSNATPLIGLAKIGRLHLLEELFGGITIPQAVYDEVVTYGVGRPGSDEVARAPWIHVRAAGDPWRTDYLRADLDPGEAEVLVLAQELHADVVLVDEPKARLAAELLGLRFIGTVGLLLTAKQTGRVPSVRTLLDDLRGQQFHMSEAVYQAVIKQAGET